MDAAESAPRSAGSADRGPAVDPVCGMEVDPAVEVEEAENPELVSVIANALRLRRLEL